MRVVVVTAFPADPSRPVGGVEAVSVILVRALAESADLDLHVVTMHPETSAAGMETWHGATVHRLPWRAGRVLTGVLGSDAVVLRRYVDELDPDIVHAHDTYGLMLWDLDRPRVLTIHGFIHADTRLSGQRWAGLRGWIWRWVEHRAWAAYPRIVSISPYVRERLGGIATGVIHDIDNPTADAFFEVDRRDAGGVVFCAASITPRKNIIGLVDAFCRLCAGGGEGTLRIAGPAPHPGYAERVRQAIRDGGVSDRVTLLPSLGTDDVCRELETASVVALVSLEENSPLVVQEAMAAGVPVVTSNRCGMPYQVTDGETGFLVDPYDPDGIASCFRRLLEDDGLRARMGKQGQRVARERFHPAAVARRTRAVYHAALEQQTKVSSDRPAEAL